ncbi:MAG: outer membrane beta-barrel protein [Xanthobacteraceae bacterium]|nr:outer membrane beta-barrel protein [Xanthobacteraceae bacterium]
MRRVFCALLVLGLASPALADDDYPFLREGKTVGPATFTRWSGFYLGGQLGYTNGNADFSEATGPVVAYALRQSTLEADFSPSTWQLLRTANQSAPSYGGFVGYNTQWQDLVLGIEANLNHAPLTLTAQSTPIGPLITAPDTLKYTHTVTIDGSGSMTNFDFATLRARAGYVAGNFLPYGFAGIAFGLANVSVAANIHDVQCTSVAPITCAPYNFSGSYGRNMEVLYGLAVGAGVDVMVTPNIFLRGEFEWDEFNPKPSIMMSLATGRVGAGFKF